jgi:hypothetical protein
MRSLVVGSFTGVFGLLSLAILGLKLFALVDAAVRPERVWRGAVQQSKTFWLVLLAVSVLLGGLGLLGIAALVATIVYLVDVRPRLLEAKGGGRSRW